HFRLTAGVRYNRERAQREDVSDIRLTLTAPLGLVLDSLPVPLPPALAEQLAALPVGVPLPQPVANVLSDALPDLVPRSYSSSGRSRYIDLLPKLGITWLIDEHNSLGLSYQEGYRSGGTSVSFFRGRVSPFEPEYTRTVELAGRSSWLDERLDLNANLFYTRWRDQQVTIGESSGFESTTENAGRSHYYGAEVELLWKVGGPLETFATLGLIRSEFDEFVNGGEDYAGNRFPYAPEHTGALGLTLREWHRVSGQVSANYIGSLYSDADNDPQSRADSRVLVNAKIGYRLPAGFSLSVYGRNLGDDVNEQGRLVAGSRTAARYGEPRSYGLVLEWQS
ncbi:MAG TPA: TonB-dependent receptor, partial [Fontimonas sp.]